MRLRTISVIGTGLLVVIVLAAATGAGLAGSAGLDSGLMPSQQALAEIPADYLQTYQQAAATCPGLPWTVLAGIGRVESDHGRNTKTSSAGAQGPMQFMAATFDRYDLPVPPGGANPPSPLDPIDAIYAAARDLCANGGRDGVDLSGAIYNYNHDTTYVADVLAFAAAYGTPGTTSASPAAVAAVSYALAQLGTPYRWGGQTPGVAFDCSGLTQAAYAAAGITLPRTAQTQYDAGPRLTPSTPLEPGDLVFFGTPGDVHHVGLVVSGTDMIDAPHPGVVVRIEPFAAADLLGFSRPAAASAPNPASTGPAVLAPPHGGI